MIKIQKEKDIKVVTQGAYKEYYEHLGYEIIKDKKPFEKEVVKKVEQAEKKADKGKLDGYSRK